jgi:hypothetical protein
MILRGEKYCFVFHIFTGGGHLIFRVLKATTAHSTQRM